jgi:hypothetical protein
MRHHNTLSDYHPQATEHLDAYNLSKSKNTQRYLKSLQYLLLGFLIPASICIYCAFTHPAWLVFTLSTPYFWISVLTFLIGSTFLEVAVASKEVAALQKTDQDPKHSYAQIYKILLIQGMLAAMPVAPLIALEPTIALMAGLGTAVIVVCCLLYAHFCKTNENINAAYLMGSNLIIGLILFDTFTMMFPYAPMLHITSAILGLMVFSVLLVGNIQRAFPKHQDTTPQNQQPDINSYLPATHATETFLLILNIFIEMFKLYSDIKSENSASAPSSFGRICLLLAAPLLIFIIAIKHPPKDLKDFMSLGFLLLAGALLGTAFYNPALLTMASPFVVIPSLCFTIPLLGLCLYFSSRSHSPTHSAGDPQGGRSPAATSSAFEHHPDQPQPSAPPAYQVWQQEPVVVHAVPVGSDHPSTQFENESMNQFTPTRT